MIFSWNDWNTAHIAKHGVTREEAEQVIRGARPPYPQQVDDDKLLAWGQTAAGRFLQVVYVLPEEFDPSSVNLFDLMDDDEVVYVIHARELNDAEKRRLRRPRP